MALTKTTKILGAAVLAAAFAQEAQARCVTAVGSEWTPQMVADVTDEAHGMRISPQFNWDPDNNWPFGDGPLGDVRVGRFDFSQAVEYCERQHRSEMEDNPGQQVITGLTCNGRDIYVITNRDPGALHCTR